jgi:hypothetical protein
MVIRRLRIAVLELFSFITVEDWRIINEYVAHVTYRLEGFHMNHIDFNQAFSGVKANCAPGICNFKKTAK